MATTDPAPTAQELYDQVNRAIRDLLSGKYQERRINDRTYRVHDLAELRLLRSELATEVTVAARGSIRVRRGFLA